MLLVSSERSGLLVSLVLNTITSLQTVTEQEHLGRDTPCLNTSFGLLVSLVLNTITFLQTLTEQEHLGRDTPCLSLQVSLDKSDYDKSDPR